MDQPTTAAPSGQATSSHAVPSADLPHGGPVDGGPNTSPPPSFARLALTANALTARIPEEWHALGQWVAWQPVERKGKWTKQPINPHNGKPASSTDPSTWGTLAEVTKYHNTHADSCGVGIVFHASERKGDDGKLIPWPGGGMVGVDLDHCIGDDGTIAPWALEILGTFPTYVEVSPSGRGVKVWAKAPALASGKNHRDWPEPGAGVEMYSSGRYFTVTGARLEGAPREVTNCSAAVAELYARIVADEEAKRTRARPASGGNGQAHESATVGAAEARASAANELSDDDLLDAARRAKNGTRFSALFGGNWQGAGYGSQSEADLALCGMLAFYAGPDAARIDRIFRRSGLMRPKWDERHGEATYGRTTIARALDGKTEFYRGATPPPVSEEAKQQAAEAIRAWTRGLTAGDPPKTFGGVFTKWGVAHVGAVPAPDIEEGWVLAHADWHPAASEPPYPGPRFNYHGLTGAWKDTVKGETGDSVISFLMKHGKVNLWPMAPEPPRAMTLCESARWLARRFGGIGVSVPREVEEAIAVFEGRAPTNGAIDPEALAEARALFTPDAVMALTSVEAVFEAEKIQALALIAEGDAAAWALAKSRLAEKFARKLRIRDLEKAVEDKRRERKRGQKQTRRASGKPTIDITNCAVSRVANEAEAALVKAGVELYQRGGELVHVVRDVQGAAAEWLIRPPGAPTIRLVSEGYLVELMERVATWERTVEGKDGEIKSCPVVPPKWAFAALSGRGAWKFDRLEAVVEAPCFLVDGSILDKPGLDQRTGLLYEPGDVVFPHVPASPTREDGLRALAELKEVFADFPFKTPHHKSAAIGGVLGLVGRYAIPGGVPLHGVSAHAAGSGKGLLVDCVALIATGHEAPKMAQVVDDEAEESKQILTIGLEGDRLAVIDNCEAPLGSGALANALTSRIYKGRILGFSKSGQAPMTASWWATGNGLQYRGDLARRVVPIDLDANCENPEEREGFAHPDLLAWVRTHRPRLVVAALTVLKAFHVAGRPRTVKLTAFGSFERWSDLIRGALTWLGEADPCAGRELVRKSADPARAAMTFLLKTWNDIFADAPKTLREVNEWIVKHKANAIFKPLDSDRPLFPTETTPEKGKDDRAETLWDALAELDFKHDGRRLDLQRLGMVFGRNQGKILGGLRLEADDRGRGGVPWKVRKAGGAL